jgi:hypothetical protein
MQNPRAWLDVQGNDCDPAYTTVTHSLTKNEIQKHAAMELVMMKFLDEPSQDVPEMMRPKARQLNIITRAASQCPINSLKVRLIDKPPFRHGRRSTSSSAFVSAGDPSSLTTLQD